MGISYNDKDIDRLAAILYGAGGGLIVDEAGLLLTFGDYWTGLTFSMFVVLLAFAFVLFLLYSYRQVLLRELGEFGRSRASLYFAVFLFAVSIAFFTETTDLFVTTASGILAAISIVIVAVSLILRRRKPN